MLAALDRPQIEGLRWTHREQWHVTLRFLGEVADAGEVVRAVKSAAASVSPVTAVMADKTARFGRSIVHVTVGGLGEWAAAIGAATAGLGSNPPDDRVFHGHVTLARNRGGDIRRVNGIPLPPGPRTWPASEVSVVRSRLRPSGAEYEKVATIPVVWRHRPPTNVRSELPWCEFLSHPLHTVPADARTTRRESPQMAAMDREKALDMALGQIDKQYGKGAVMRMGDKAVVPVNSVSTGALALDIALGIGGLPRGRVVEIYGPESSGKTTLAMHVVAEAQRNGGICAYVDAEHAVDPVYARAIGVDVDNLLISQPDTGEQALEITDMLVRSGALDVVVIDSVAALTPRAEIEGEMGDSHVGLQARLMSQALRKLTANLNKTDTICIFINQLREKIGVMFGCFAYGTRVTLADGTQEKIGKIVNQKLPVEVLSYDPERNEVVPRKVVNWFDNGRTDSFLTFTVAKPGGNGRAQFQCTPNHLLATPAGWREAGELIAGDRVLQNVERRLSDRQWEILLGGLMGDGALSPTRSGHGARFRWGHGAKQAAYGEWKASHFANLTVSRSTNAKGAVFHDVQPLPELAELRRAVYVGGKKVFGYDYLKQLTPLSLAVWYMDDGSFQLRAAGLQERTRDGSGRSEICVEAMEVTTRQRLVDHLRDTWGIDGKLVERGGKAIVVFTKDETAKLHALIAPFVHPSMAYKLLPKYRDRFAVEPVFAAPRRELMPLPITSIGSRPAGRSSHRFDIEVEGNHNYFVDGVMVHNSPETTPGGRALKFYSSVRLDIRRIESIKDGAEVTGNRVRVKVAKNKVAAPFKQAEFDITFGRGISREGSLLDIAVDLGIVKKSGAWYTYEGEQLGQGREKVKEFLSESPELMIELNERVRVAAGIGGGVVEEVPLGEGIGDDEPITLDD